MKSTVVEGRDKARQGIHSSILNVIGNTPIIKLSSRMQPPGGASVYLKLESLNPGGSVKDRLAIGMIEWAEQHGHLQPGQTVVEASSGNTGIGLAMVCAAKGYPFVCVMSEAFSVERRKLMRFYGAQVILTSAKAKATGMLMKAKELSLEHGFYFPNQFEHEANAWIHEHTTGREIQEAFDQEQLELHHCVVPFGTGGTVAGISRALRKWSPSTKIHVCEPTNAPMLQSNIGTVYPTNGTPSSSFQTSHPSWNPHLLQGWAVDFIPKVLAKAKEDKAYDEIHHVDSTVAVMTSRTLARKEGILTGISGGGSLSVALKLAKTLPANENVLVTIADTGERYLSTALFDGIPTEMTSDEAYLEATALAQDPPPVPLLEATPEADQFVQEQIEKHIVLVFGIEHSGPVQEVITFFKKIKVHATKIFVDDIKYVANNMGPQYKTALCKIVGNTILPQVFIGGKHVGDHSTIFSLWATGNLQDTLTATGGDIKIPASLVEHPLKCLPEWAVKEFGATATGTVVGDGGPNDDLASVASGGRKSSVTSSSRKLVDGKTKRRYKQQQQQQQQSGANGLGGGKSEHSQPSVGSLGSMSSCGTSLASETTSNSRSKKGTSSKNGESSLSIKDRLKMKMEKSRRGSTK